MDDLDLYHIPPANVFVEAYQDNLVYNNAVWLTAHNAYANEEDGWSYAQQSMNLEHMFYNGVRSFMIDAYIDKGELYLCHGDCSLTAILKLSSPDKLAPWLKIYTNY